MSEKYAVNLVDKPITEFTTDDTIYMSKISNGFQTIFFCQFKSFEKGMVTATVISTDQKHRGHDEIGKDIRARLKKCCLWGLREEERNLMSWNHYHWFKDKNTPAGKNKV